MRIQAILHARFEKLGAIDAWVESNGHQLTKVHVYDGEQLLPPSEYDLLIIMGGPQSPTELDKYPYLRDEIEAIQAAIKLNKAILGVCLGAQLIGEALGAATQHSPEKEIGVYPIELTAAGKQDAILKNFPSEFNVAHWHYDMPGLPEGAECLATSLGCPNQIFRYGDRVYGLQCHMELTKRLIGVLADHCPQDLTPSQFTQTKEVMWTYDYDAINQYMDQVLDGLVKVSRLQ